MDRKRNRKNATCGQQITRYLIVFLGFSLLFSCTHQEKQIIDHAPVFHQGNNSNEGLSMQQRFAGILSVHNQVRSRHNLPPLRWSKKLAEYSLQWANHLGKGRQCQMYHRGGNPPYGENLYISSAEVWRDETGREVERRISPVTIKEVVNAWASEEKYYDYQHNRCQPGQQCGHYTQIVWRDTKEVGCAMKVCADKSQTWVCSYNPPGNYVGDRPY